MEDLDDVIATTVAAQKVIQAKLDRLERRGEEEGGGGGGATPTQRPLEKICELFL